jgi:hypothetical protein
MSTTPTASFKDQTSAEPAELPVSGFSDAGTRFAQPSRDDVRFAESMALVRNFSAIDDDAARRQVLELAARLASR